MATVTFVCAAFVLLSLVNGGMAVDTEIEPNEEEIQTRFNEADKDGNEKLSAKEFKEFIQTLYGQIVEEDELNYVFPAYVKIIDEDGDGMINCSEITKAILNQPNAEQNARNLFTIWDADFNGKVTEAELMEFDRIMNDGFAADSVNELIKNADQDGDGMITFEEYISAVNKKKSVLLK